MTLLDFSKTAAATDADPPSIEWWLGLFLIMLSHSPWFLIGLTYLRLRLGHECIIANTFATISMCFLCMLMTIKYEILDNEYKPISRARLETIIYQNFYGMNIYDVRGLHLLFMGINFAFLLLLTLKNEYRTTDHYYHALIMCGGLVLFADAAVLEDGSDKSGYRILPILLFGVFIILKRIYEAWFLGQREERFTPLPRFGPQYSVAAVLGMWLFSMFCNLVASLAEDPHTSVIMPFYLIWNTANGVAFLWTVQLIGRTVHRGKLVCPGDVAVNSNTDSTTITGENAGSGLGPGGNSTSNLDTTVNTESRAFGRHDSISSELGRENFPTAYGASNNMLPPVLADKQSGSDQQQNTFQQSTAAPKSGITSFSLRNAGLTSASVTPLNVDPPINKWEQSDVSNQSNQNQQYQQLQQLQDKNNNSDSNNTTVQQISNMNQNDAVQNQSTAFAMPKTLPQPQIRGNGMIIGNSSLMGRSISEDNQNEVVNNQSQNSGPGGPQQNTSIVTQIQSQKNTITNQQNDSSSSSNASSVDGVDINREGSMITTNVPSTLMNNTNVIHPAANGNSTSNNEISTVPSSVTNLISPKAAADSILLPGPNQVADPFTGNPTNASLTQTFPKAFLPNPKVMALNVMAKAKTAPKAETTAPGPGGPGQGPGIVTTAISAVNLSSSSSSEGNESHNENNLNQIQSQNNNLSKESGFTQSLNESAIATDANVTTSTGKTLQVGQALPVSMAKPPIQSINNNTNNISTEVSSVPLVPAPPASGTSVVTNKNDYSTITSEMGNGNGNLNTTVATVATGTSTGGSGKKKGGKSKKSTNSTTTTTGLKSTTDDLETMIANIGNNIEQEQ